MSDLALLVGRLLFGGLFLYNGINHFQNLAALTGYAKYKHVPSPAAAVAVSGVWMIVSSLSIMLGIRPHAGAAMIAVFLLIALWAFSRSSDRLHGWVKRMPLFREALVHVERYHAERTISRGVKLIAVCCAWTSVVLFFLSRGLQPSAVALTLVVLAMACTVFMAVTRTASPNRS